MKNSAKIILGLLFNFGFNLVYAQVAPSIEWQKCMGGSDYEYAFSVQQTIDNGFILAGCSSSIDGDVTENYGDFDCWIVKLHSDGSLAWQKSYGGLLHDDGYSIRQTIDGGFVIAGSSYSHGPNSSPNHGYSDFLVFKIDSIGNPQWAKLLGGSSDDRAYSVEQTSDKGFIVAGQTGSDDGDVSGYHGGGDCWVVKLDSSGNLVWQKSYGGSSWDYANSIVPTSDGGYILAGISESNDGDVSGNHGLSDYWIVKLDGVGNLTWQKSFGCGLGDQDYSIQETTDGGFIIAGLATTNSGDVTGNHGDDYWIIKLDSYGNLVWQKCFGGSQLDEAHSIQETKDGGFVIAGYAQSNDGDVSGNHGGFDFWILKINAMGNLVWQKSLGGSEYDLALSVQQTSDEGYIVAGATFSNDGDVSGNHGDGDYWIVKLSGGIATQASTSFMDQETLFPNPVQSQLTISLATPASEVRILVYDVQGKMITLPISNFQSQTSNSFQLNTENLPSGFYTLQIINNKTGESQVGKFVKAD